jgi:hypothetical protein
MSSFVPTSTSFSYVESDIPAEQTLVEWRREREAQRAAERPSRRGLRLWFARWAT